MKIFSKTYSKHESHQVEIIPTPHLKHYAALRCKQCEGVHLKWLGREECSKLGVDLPKKSPQRKTKRNWSQATTKERTFYKSYQPTNLNRGKTPSQLIGDRLALSGRSQYNGNPLHKIPLDYLKLIMKTKINNRDDKAFIERHIALRSGSEPGPSEQ
jgi:hypothetical protein